MKSLVGVYGASGCGRGILPLVREQLSANDTQIVFVDDSITESVVNGVRVVSWEEFRESSAIEKRVAIAIANSGIRQAISEKCAAAGIELLSVRAADYIEMDEVEIGAGALLSPRVTITSNVVIGRCFHANLYSYVEHDCVIGDFVTFAPRVSCNGNVHIGDHAYIGTGAVIRQGTPDKPLRIGRGAIIGMGAVVTKDVPDGVTVVGNPARPLIKD